ncbi:hypothetical protein C8J31_102114 [Rhizobium sp. PP-CC-2G-626]|nr:hypothetical protein C8J31_102114 [Rhizobium sp. PP-CC-2G-626]
MNVTNKDMDLIDCIQVITAEQAKLPTDDSNEAGRKARREAIENMCRAIEANLPNVRVKERWSGCTVTIMGVRASCTGGINGAFSNWIAAARRRMDRDLSNGEKENVR